MGISLIIAHEQREVLDTDYFVEQLRLKWSDAKVHFISDPDAPILQFQTPDDFWGLGDFLGTGIFYKGYSHSEDVQFALWYRSIVPAEWQLQVYDSALTFDLFLLTRETTADQLLAAFSIPFDYSKYE